MARRSENWGAEVIVSAAEKRFVQWGFSGTSTAALAEDLGITKAALYYHFPDKEALFLATIEAHLTGLSQALGPVAPLFDGGDREGAFRALAQVFLDVEGKSSRIQQLIFQESRHLTKAGQETLMVRYHELVAGPLTALLGKAQARGWVRRPAPDEPQTIWLFFGLVAAFLRPGHGGPALGQSPSTTAFVRLFLGGIGVKP